MLCVPLVLLLAAAPLAAQEPDDAAQGTILPVRHLGTVLAGELRFPTPRPKFPTVVSFALGSDQLSLSDPFGRRGSRGFSKIATGIRFAFDTDWWHLDASGQILGQSFEQRRIEVALNGPFVHFGNESGIGLELAYQELGYHRRAEAIVDTGLDTAHVERSYGVGLALRATTPYDTILRASFTIGQLENKYDSIIVTNTFTGTEPVVSETVSIITTRVLLETGQVMGRFRVSCGVRYIRTLQERSSWTPRNELSGNVTFDARILGGPRSSLLLGITGQLGPRELMLASDRAVGMRMTWKIR